MASSDNDDAPPGRRRGSGGSSAKAVLKRENSSGSAGAPPRRSSRRSSSVGSKNRNHGCIKDDPGHEEESLESSDHDMEETKPKAIAKQGRRKSSADSAKKPTRQRVTKRKPHYKDETRHNEASAEGSDQESEAAEVTKPKAVAKKGRRKSSTESTKKPKRQRAGKRKPNYRDDSSHDEATAEGSDQESEAGEVTKPKKDKRRDRGSVLDRTCPDCNKVFSAINGLEYHVQRKVCQKPAAKRKRVKVEEGTENPTVKRKRNKMEEDTEDQPPNRRKGTGSGSPKKRGKKKHVCEHCNRVFTVALGLQYHVKHKVCQREKNTSKQQFTAASFETLSAGSRFVTAYGVVEVVSDTRETPADFEPPKNMKALLKKRSTAKSKREAKRKNRLVVAAVKNRVRRRKLMQLYEQGDMAQDKVWKAYFGGDPTVKKEHVKRPLPEKTEEEDPLVPKTSYPYRIVECVLIPDERSVIDSTEVGEAPKERTMAECGMRLFLQRRLLTQPYNVDVPKYTCQECGIQLGSKDGYVYHVKGEVCTKKAKAREEQSRERIQLVDEGMELKLKEKMKSKRAMRKRQQNGVPNQLMEELGYRGDLPETPGSSAAMGEEEKEEFDIGPDLKHPDEELNRLQGELEKLEAILAQPKPFVEEKKRKKKKKKKRKRRKQKKLKVKEEEAKLPPASLPTDMPPPPIIDTVVLVDEVDAGRYPSMKRFDGEHSYQCALCKEDDGKLLCCNFCRNAEHLECMLCKFTVKEPEPEEDFMCHKCVGYLITMRSRAEKRRIEKAAVAPDDGMADNEYYVMARKAREVSELTELLQDAKTRLKHSMNVDKVNSIRRGLLEPTEGLL